MRLWHYRLLPYLPRQQLLSQWRECCCIAKSIAEKGTPNHILVNKIMDYPIDHFVEYCYKICIEMEHRGYRCDFSRIDRYLETIAGVSRPPKISFERLDFYAALIALQRNGEQIFPEWHNDIYLRECLYNLEEKFRAGGIPVDEWQVIYDRFKDFTPLWCGE